MQVREYPFKAFSAEEITSMPFSVVKIDDNIMIIGHFSETDKDWLIQLEFGFRAVQVTDNLYEITPITDTPVVSLGSCFGDKKPFSALPMCEEQFFGFMLSIEAQRVVKEFTKRMGVGLN